MEERASPVLHPGEKQQKQPGPSTSCLIPKLGHPCTARKTLPISGLRDIIEADSERAFPT